MSLYSIHLLTAGQSFVSDSSGSQLLFAPPLSSESGLLVLGLLGFFCGQRLKSIMVEQCLKVLPAHKQTAHSFTDAEGTYFSTPNAAN